MRCLNPDRQYQQLWQCYLVKVFEAGHIGIQSCLWGLVRVSFRLCYLIFWQDSKNHIYVCVLGRVSCVDHSAADIVIGVDNEFLHEVSTLQTVHTELCDV